MPHSFPGLHSSHDIIQLPSAPAAVELTPALVILSAVVYGVLFFSMGSIWLPGNAAFCALLIWAVGVGLAAVSQWVSFGWQQHRQPGNPSWELLVFREATQH